MKRLLHIILLSCAMLGTVFGANAQYATIANQITGILGPALTGGMNYKGYVEAEYLRGIGQNKAGFAGVSTSQGWMYGPHFFMGLGLGVDALIAEVDPEVATPGNLDKQLTKTGCVIPVFTDFRGIFGRDGGIKCQVGLKMGCSFLVSNNYISMNTGYITANECFYLKPSIGARIPVAASAPKQAITVSVAYQLITPGWRDYSYSGQRAISLSSLGVTVGYEW